MKANTSLLCTVKFHRYYDEDSMKHTIEVVIEDCTTGEITVKKYQHRNWRSVEGIAKCNVTKFVRKLARKYDLLCYTYSTENR